MAAALAAQAGFDVAAKYGMPFGPDVKSDGLPKKFQRSVNSPVPLTSVPRSIGPQGCALFRVTMEFSSQPSSSCANDFLPGTRYVKERVKRWRISKSLLAYSNPGFA